MTPAPDVLGVVELAIRWGVSRQLADRVTRRDGFPDGRQLTMGRVWSRDDITTWEATERAAGRDLPGEHPRGPRAGEGGRPRRDA